VSFYNLKILSAVFTFLPMDNILFFSTNYFPETIVSKDHLIKLYVQQVCIFYVTDGNIMYLTDASRSLISCLIQHYAPVVGWGGGGWRNRCIMLIITLDPSWRQTLRLPLPGIERGSPASQAGTLPKELSRQLTPVLRNPGFLSQSPDPDF
jgi:hypothetical protein